MSEIVNKTNTGMESFNISKEQLDEMLIESFADSKGDQDLFYEFLSYKFKKYFNNIKDISFYNTDSSEMIWKINIIFTDGETKQFDVNMNNIKIPEKYLED